MLFRSVLDKAQSNIRQIALPALVSGGPGTGKSCLSFIKLLQFIEHLPAYSKKPVQALYVTESKELLDEMQRLFNEHIHLGLSSLPANCSIQFKTTTQVANENSTVSKDYAFFSMPEEIIKADLMQYLTTQIDAEKKKRNKSIPVEQSIELMYQEIRALSGYSFLNDYEKAVGSHSLFPEKKHKEWLWNVYDTYRKKILDPKTEFSGEPTQYDLVVVDEVQDLWRLLIKLLAKLANNHQIFYCVGDHQSLYDSEFIVPFIKTLHWNAKPALNHQVLQAVYRCSQNIVEVANAVLHMSAFLTGDDRYQVTTIQASEDTKDSLGNVFWLTKETEITSLFQQNEFFVVVVPEEFSEPTKQETLKKLFGDKLVLTIEQFKTFSGASEEIAGIAFTIKQIKGLGFANVFIYQPLQHNTRFIEANKKFPNEFDFYATTKTQKRLKKSQENIYLRPAFNGLFVELTRTTGNVFIFQPHEKSITNLSQNLAKFIKVRKNKIVPKLVDITAEQKTAEIEQVRHLLQAKPEPVSVMTSVPACSKNSKQISKISVVVPPKKTTAFFAPVAKRAPQKTVPKVVASSSNNLEETSQTLLDAINSNKLHVIKELLIKYPKLANYRNQFGIIPLHAAVQANHIMAVRCLIAHKANINCVIDDGATPLYLAAQDGHLNIVEYLLENGAEINCAANDGTISLHMAVCNNYYEIVKLLLVNGINVNYVSHAGATSLQFAVQNGFFDIINLLIEYGANVNCKAQDGTTPLHHATQNNHFEIVKCLLENKAYVDCVVGDGVTPLYIATQKGYLEIVKFLITCRANINYPRQYGSTLLHVASLNNHLEIVKFLLVQGADINCTLVDGTTPLYIAVLNGQLEMVKFLIEKGADIYRATNKGATPLQCAIQKGHFDLIKFLKIVKSEHVSSSVQSNSVPPIISSSVVANSSNNLEVNFQALCNAIKSDDLEMVKLLLAKNPNLINQASKGGLSPLHAAILFGCPEIAKYLIAHNAKLNCTTHDGFTPLHEAAKYGHFDMVKLLIENNADVNCINHHGQTPLHEAAYSGHFDVIEFLIKNGAQVNCTTTQGATPLHLAAQKGYLDIVTYLTKNKAQINCSRHDGTTPLHGAANYGVLDVVMYLLENEANVNCSTHEGITPLFYAAQNGHLTVVECLIKNRADFSHAKSDGRTPLCVAVHNGHFNVVKFLIEKGADIHRVTDKGQTPIHDAAYSGNFDMIKLLVENGAKIDCVTPNGLTPLALAKHNKHLKIIKYLEIELAKADISSALSCALLIKPNHI